MKTYMREIPEGTTHAPYSEIKPARKLSDIQQAVIAEREEIKQMIRSLRPMFPASIDWLVDDYRQFICKLIDTRGEKE